MTPQIKLVPKTAAEARAMIEALSPADRAQVSADWLARLNAPSSEDEQWTFGYTTLNEDGVVVGQCGFKGPPDGERVVEIAYGTNPEFEGRGYATEAARELVRIALSRPTVGVVRAHTIAPDNASTRVLTKVGFVGVGDVMDPEDGRVWRWELQGGNG